MTKIRTLWFGGAVLIAALGTVPATAFADFQPTAEQRSACMGDTIRLCSSEIPNMSRIVDCLARHKSKISPQCRAHIDKIGV